MSLLANVSIADVLQEKKNKGISNGLLQLSHTDTVEECLKQLKNKKILSAPVCLRLA